MNTGLTYEEVIEETQEPIIIRQERALQELRKHGVPESEFQMFFNELGNKETYLARAVLIYLGY